jgi:hypothetical protein
VNRKLWQGLLFVTMVMAACSSPTGQSPSGPVGQLVDYVDEKSRLPRRACLRTLSQAHDQLPALIEEEAALRTDLVTNPLGLFEAYQGAARRAGVRQAFPSSTFDTDGGSLRIEALNWCGGWAQGSSYDLYMADLGTGDVWYVGERDVPSAGPEVRWLGDDAWAVITYWGAPGGYETHLEIVVEEDGRWTSIFRSGQPAAGNTPLVWITQGSPPQFQFNGFEHLLVTWQPPGGTAVTTEYEWRNDTYVEVGEQPAQP